MRPPPAPTAKPPEPLLERLRARAPSSGPWLAVLAASFLFRLPPLINAPGTNADAAVVGLQAMHILRGEWSPFLLGSGYQTSVDAFIAALFFLVTGPSPLALMLSTLLGHVLLTYFAFAILRRRLSPILAAILVLPLVFAPDPVHTYVLYPPRQASLTLAFASLWILDAAPRALASMPAPRRFALGGALALLAVFADPYALLFLPLLILHGVLAALSPALPASAAPAAPAPNTSRAESVRERIRTALHEARPKLLGLALGAILGAVPYAILRSSPRATHGQTSLTLAVVPHNATLLLDTCLPWLLSTKVFAARHMSDYAELLPSPGLHALQILGAALLVTGILSGGALAFASRIPWETRRIGLIGALAIPVTLGGFLVSPMVMDHFSSRYLAAILLLAPLALAPIASLLASLLGLRRVALGLAPYLLSAALAGWAAYAPFGLAVHPSLRADARLGEELRARGLNYAVADYWASYRLTFLYREHPLIVPTNEAEDRYPPYRARVLAAPRVAYIHDAYRSREDLAQLERRIQSDATEYEPSYDRFEVEHFTVLVLRRKAQDSRSAWH